MLSLADVGQAATHIPHLMQYENCRKDSSSSGVWANSAVGVSISSLSQRIIYGFIDLWFSKRVFNSGTRSLMIGRLGRGLIVRVVESNSSICV